MEVYSITLYEKVKSKNNPYFLGMVGVTGLEPAASPTPWVRASQLRHTPTAESVAGKL